MSNETQYVPNPASPYVPFVPDLPAAGGNTFVDAYTDPNTYVSGSVGDSYFSAPSLGGDGTSWVKVTGSNSKTGWE